jgi:hypothetical protein
VTVSPDVPIALFAVARGSAVDEPRALIGGVVRDPIGEEADTSGVGVGKEAVEALQSAKQRVDVAVVEDVVAKVGHG